jgi:hypothetical protein
MVIQKLFYKKVVCMKMKRLVSSCKTTTIFTHYSIQRILIILGISFPLSIIITGVTCTAYALIEAARVESAKGTVLIQKHSPSKSVSSPSKSVNNNGFTPDGKRAELRDPKDQLTVDGDNNSQATFISVPSKPKGMKFLAAPSSGSVSIYSFPCNGGRGRFVFGWQKGKQRVCDPPGITISKLNSNLHTRHLSTPIKVAQALNSGLITQLSDSQLQFQYCSVAAKGYGWWTRWGTWTDDYNPCQEAEQECLRYSSSENCVTVSIGDWSARDSDLLVSVECANNRILTGRGNGIRVAKVLIEELAGQAKLDGEKACALNVFSADKLIVSPASNGTTLIQTQDFNGNLEVDALAGNVIIRSERKPGGTLLRVGNRYTYPQDDIQPINVSEIAETPPIQAFLDEANWPTASSDIDEYKAALGREEEVGLGGASLDKPPDDPSDTSGSDTPKVINILWNVWGMIQPSSRPGNSQYPYPSSPSTFPNLSPSTP